MEKNIEYIETERVKVFRESLTEYIKSEFSPNWDRIN